MKKSTLIIGFMLFAIFFGSGNLIFPPKMGLESGQFLSTAMFGFILTGVGLPLLSIVVSAKYEGGYKAALNKINPYFSLILLSAIYLTIGPFFVIPRTGNVSYELSIVPFLTEPNSTTLFIFTIGYYLISLWLSLNPTKMVDRIGAILTPVLLLTVLALIIKSLFVLGDNPSSVATPAYDNGSAFFSGFLEGYNTMDVIASIAFSVIVLNAIKGKTNNHNELFKQSAKAGVIAAVGLAAIYIALGWIGNHLPISETEMADITAKGQNIGTYILNRATFLAFGDLGTAVLGIIAGLACLTTTIGLIVSTSAYFHEVFPKISYKAFAIIFTLIGFGLANQGLSVVISKSIPVLLVLYPIAMTVLLLLAINLVLPISLLAQRISLALVTIVSILSVAGVGFIEQLPLKTYSMEWLPFAIGGAVVGLILTPLCKAKG